jgi:uracil-DNA glycosylase family protein
MPARIPLVSAAEYLPKNHSLSALRAAAQHCEGCPLFVNATQTVFGDGKRTAKLMLVGEQPGDQEDRSGKPFVGPAGLLLHDLLREAKIEPSAIYVTNAVKHFKWIPRGKRRLHAKPTSREVKACHPWLLAEIDAVRPRAIVCLGATALQSLFGSEARVTEVLGQQLTYAEEYPLIATYHPSAVLRAPAESREKMRQALLEHLAAAESILQT